MYDAKPLEVPLPPHVKLSKADCPNDEMTGDDMRDFPYASACESLMYAMVATHPDIAYAMGVLHVKSRQVTLASCQMHP